MEHVDEDPSNPKDQWIDKQGTRNKIYVLFIDKLYCIWFPEE